MNKEGQNGDVYDLEQTAKACESFAGQVEQIIENVENRVLQGIRPPSEVKKELKHEKNPMRVKQLNRELNESYKWYRWYRAREDEE